MVSRFDGERIFGRVSGVSYADLSMTDCEFSGCHAVRDPGSPANLFERIEIERASQMNCSIREAVLRDVRVHGLKRLGDAPLFLWGCHFERVTLSGRISALKINQSVTLPEPPDRQGAHNAATVQFYSSSDWALDISEAEFPGGVTFEAIPGDKMRRDPERQVLVARAALADWPQIDFDGTALDIALSWFVRHSLFDSVVLAARCDRKWAKRDLAVLQRLRDAGIAAG